MGGLTVVRTAQRVRKSRKFQEQDPPALSLGMETRRQGLCLAFDALERAGEVWARHGRGEMCGPGHTIMSILGDSCRFPYIKLSICDQLPYTHREGRASICMLPCSVGTKLIAHGTTSRGSPTDGGHLFTDGEGGGTHFRSSSRIFGGRRQWRRHYDG